MRIAYKLAAVIVLLAVFTLGTGIAPRAEAVTQTSTGSFAVTCTGFTITGAGDYTMDRDNTGTGNEQAYLRFYDGAGTILFDGSIIWPDGTNWSFAVGYSTGWATAPSYNPITAQLVSIAGGIYAEQTIALTVTGNCAGLPTYGEEEVEEVVLPGCDATLSIPSTAVGGTFVADAAVYWTPGELTAPLVTIPAGKSVRVIGLDASGQYYQVIWECDFLWVEKATLGPNFDSVWNGAALPTGVVN